MNASRCFTLLVVVMLGMTSLCATEWRIPDHAPLLTRWAKDVSPTNALPEYPRPQMVRSTWQNLNGLWDYAITDKSAEQKPSAWDGKILVPYPIESALSGVMRPLKPDQRLWYRRTFTVPPAWNGQRILLHFGAVDWEAEVFVNGQRAGIHRGGYDPFSFDITTLLNGSGPQELVVRVFDDTNGAQHPVGKQSLKPGGMWYSPASGIWQTVWLEPVPATSIASLKLTPDVDQHRLKLTVHTTGATQGVTVTAVARFVAEVAGVITGAANAELSLNLANPRLWSPDKPDLYDLQVSLVSRGNKIDTVTSYFGMRKITIVPGRFPEIHLNGKKIVQLGLLDQGYWPDGIYTAPTDEALKWDIVQQRAFGCNMVRKHVKVEPARWYYWADKLGLLVWQDMPTRMNPVDPNYNAQFESELQRMVMTLYNHPCIVTWIDFNENWGHYDAARIANLVKSWDPTRLVTYDSGEFNAPAGDLNDIHNYPYPSYPIPTNKPRILGEHGVGHLGIDGHFWHRKDTSRYLRTADDLQNLYAEFADLTRSFVVTEGLQGIVYTQFTDVEEEQNGLWTYDRQVCKVKPTAIHAINQAIIHPENTWYYTRIVDTSDRFRDGLAGWQYTTNAPPTDWHTATFDASAWATGTGAFGNHGDRVHTRWNSSEIWLRKTFSFGAQQHATNLRLRVRHQGAAEYYLNGVLAFSEDGDNQIYRVVAINPAAQKAIQTGSNNVFAIHSRQSGRERYVDGGILYVNPPQTKTP